MRQAIFVMSDRKITIKIYVLKATVGCQMKEMIF